MGIITLTGCMGCGKSSVGRSLAFRLGCDFIDLDEYIEKKQECSVSEIFASQGEAFFRKLEMESLLEIIERCEGQDLVLSLGGGTVTSKDAADAIHEMTDCWYLKAGVDTLASHVGNGSGRPLLEGSDLKARLSSLLAEREAIYERTAHHIVVTDGLSVREVSSDIIRALGKSC